MTVVERVAWFIGEIARPIAIIVSATGASAATIIVAFRVDNGNDGGFLIGAAFGGVVGVVGFKAAEVWKSRKYESETAIAAAPTPTPEVPRAAD